VTHFDASEFDRGISVSAWPDDPTTYAAELGAGWQIGSGINGGMLLATMGNALRSTLSGSGHGDPVTVSGYYLSASRPGPATVRTELLRSGRSMSTGQASLVQRQDGVEVERIRALATYGDLAGLADGVRTTAKPPVLPPPDECVSTADAPPSFMEQAGLLERLDLRLDPACVGWAVGKPSGRGLIQGWLRMADPREPDPLLLLLAADALPPVTFDLGQFGWTPTLELTVHVRAVPAPGWLRVVHSTRNVAGGLLEEDAEVWDSADRLVAQSRQLARAPR
jgi:acyl-coenzyme A thioesterase PaaI-like protein